MRRKVQDEPKKGAPTFMNTYGDMMTLLLTFFILLFSMSSIDASKFKAFIDSFSGSTGLLNGLDSIVYENGTEVFPQEESVISALNEVEQVKSEIKKFIYDKQLDHKVEVEQNGNEIVLTFEDMLLFDTGKADIKPAAIPILSTIGNKLITYLEEGYHLKVEGHTDNVPIKTLQFPSNWELSSSRAIAVAKFFIEEMDFTPAFVSTEGFGEYRPVENNDTPEGRSKNRRVELKLTKISDKD